MISPPLFAVKTVLVTLELFLCDSRSYMKKSADLRVAMTQKKCELGENDMRGEIESLKRNVDEESRVNSEIESYLQSQIIVSSQSIIFQRMKMQQL